MTPSATPAWLVALKPLGEAILFLWRLMMSLFRLAAYVYAPYGFLMFLLVQQVDQKSANEPYIALEGLSRSSHLLFSMSVAAAIIAITAQFMFKGDPFGRLLPDRWRDGINGRFDRIAAALERRWPRRGR